MTRPLKCVFYGLLSIGAIVFVTGLLFLLYPDPFLDFYVKGWIVEAFHEAYPAYDLETGGMHYSLWENSLRLDSLTLTSIDSTLWCSVSRISVRGIDWCEFLWVGSPVASVFRAVIVDAHRVVVLFPQEQYELLSGRLQVSLPDSEFVVEGMELHPSGNDEQFFGGSRFRRTRFQVVVPLVRVRGLNGLELAEGKGYEARAVHIGDPFIDVLINKEKPTVQDSVGPSMPNEILSSIEESIRVDSLQIRNGNLTYGERFMVGSKPAQLSFNSMQVAITGIANQGGDRDTVLVDAEAAFVGSAKMVVRMAMPVRSRGFSMHYAGSLAGMDLHLLNDWLGPSDQTRVKSGVLLGATFDIDVRSGRATGDVRASYTDLELAVINKHTGSEAGFVDGIASFIANTFKIRGTNVPDESGAMKIGIVTYERKGDDPFFGMMWFALRSGVGDVVGF